MLRKKEGKIGRANRLAKFRMPKDAVIDYKNLTLLQRYVTDGGKLLPRRITGIGAKQQRLLSIAVKRARFLSLLPTGARK